MDTSMTNRLDRAYFAYQDEFENKALEVLRSGWYVLGHELEHFESIFAKYIGTDYSLGVASGLDALTLAFRALGIGKGDEVICPSNTFIASIMGVTINGATPVFCEPDMYYTIDAAKIESLISNKTKAILVVHLYGQPAQMDKIVSICKKYNLKLVEDCAQSHGATYNGQTTGSFGDIGCFSFYPTKNIGAFGDAGAITTNDKDLMAKIRMLRNYGSEKRYYNKEIGMNSRMDEIQAGLLSVRLSHSKEMLDEKIALGERYASELKNTQIILPSVRKNATHVYHQFVIRCERRNELIEYCNKNNIGTIIHYPIPPHLAEGYSYLGYNKGDFPIAEKYADEVLSIPIYNGMTEDEQTYVISKLNAFS